MRCLIVLAILLISTVCFSADQTATDCSAVAIKAAVDACYATGGGIVNLPACKDGAKGSTWASGNGVCVHATGNTEIRILGAGMNETVIQYADGAGSAYSCLHAGATGKTYSKGEYMIEVSGLGFKELGNLTLKGANTGGKGGLLFVGGNDCFDGTAMNAARFHHLGLLQSWSGSHGYICSAPWLNQALLFDHLSIGQKKYDYAYGLRVHGNNDTSTWENPPIYGTNKGVFIEDSVFDGTYHPIAGHGSAIYTVRYNTFRNATSGMEGHGPSYSFGCQPGTGRGGSPSCADPWECYQGVQRVDVYKNVFEATVHYSTYTRSGTWAIHENTFIGQDSPIHIEMENDSAGPNCTAANNCPKQDVTTVDLTKSCGSAGITGCWQSPDGVYIWNNDFQQGSSCTNADPVQCIGLSQKSTGCLRQNFEWFLRSPQAGDPRITSYASFTYPHPLQTGTIPPPPPPPPPPPVCTPLPTETRTLACPTGQTGLIIEQRISTCPGPVWGNWTVVSNTCAVIPPPPPPPPAKTKVKTIVTFPDGTTQEMGMEY